MSMFVEKNVSNYVAHVSAVLGQGGDNKTDERIGNRRGAGSARNYRSDTSTSETFRVLRFPQKRIRFNTDYDFAFR